MTRHLANTWLKISTPKTTKCGKIMKLRSPSKYLDATMKTTSTKSTSNQNCVAIVMTFNPNQQGQDLQNLCQC